MNGTGSVVALHTTSERAKPMDSRQRIETVAGKGVKGDRKFSSDGAGQGEALTLIESEAVEGVAREYGISISFADHRRNITTSDVALNHLVGHRFYVGDILCEGVALCEPCTHLEALTEAGVRKAFVHRGGLRADVLGDGIITVGDSIRPV